MICSILPNNVARQLTWICHYDYSKIPDAASRAFHFLEDSLKSLDRRLWNKLAEWRGVAIIIPIAIPQNASQELVLLINRLNRWQALGKPSEQRYDTCLKILACRAQILLGHAAYLDLSHGNLKDLPPIFDLSPFEQIKYLCLAHNRLSRLPDNIERLVDLNVLDVSCNCLKALPNIHLCTKLAVLNVHYNYLESLPEDIGALQELTTFNASHNFLRDLPESLHFLLQLTTLDLSHNRLTRVAEELGFLENLTSLHLNDNQLSEIPRTLNNLIHLTDLSLQNNFFQASPEMLSALPQTCAITVNGEKPVVQKISSRHSSRSPSPKKGPKVYYLPYEDGEGEFYHGTLRAKISELFSMANKKRRPLPHLYATGQKQRKSLIDWLNRLPAVLPVNTSHAKSLTRRIVSHLKHAERDLPFQRFFFEHLNEATAHCDDRAAFPILKIDIGYQLAHIDKKNINRVAQFLIKTVWAMDLLDQCAQNKCIEDNSADPIEVFMAYPIQLRERLDLEISLKSMKYFTSSHVTPEDLLSAEHFVKSQRKNLEAQYLFLKDQEAWHETLRIAYPEEYKQMERDNEQDAELYPTDLDSYKEVQRNAQIQTEQKDRRIIYLTRKAFTEKCRPIN